MPAAEDHIPQSVDAEREVLASIFDSAPAIKGVAATGLQPEHFFFDKHRAIFRAQRAVARSGAHPDGLAVWAALEVMGLSSEGYLDKTHVMALVGTSSAPFNVQTHCRRLIELASKRVKIEGAHRILEGAREKQAARSEELIHEGLQLVSTDFTVEAEPTSPSELADDFYEFLDSEEPAEVFELPWKALNSSVNGGYRRGEISVLSGWTNIGKSLVLDQMLTAFSEQGKKTAIFMTEMKQRQRVARFITSRTRIPTEKILLKEMTKEQWARAVAVLPEIPFTLVPVLGWHYEKIAEQIAFGGFDVAAVDHVTRIPGFAKTEVASEISGRFAEVAERADLHLILVAQLKKERVEKGKPPKPNLYDLRNTSQLAEDAHQILFLHREKVGEEFVRKGEIYFGKIRNGAGKGSVDVEFTPLTLGFIPTDEPEQESLELGPESPPAHDQRRDD